MRVFLDTNVLVSAFTTRGICADVVTVVVAEHQLVLGESVLAELTRVLSDKMKVPAPTIEEAESFLRQQAAVVSHRTEPDVNSATRTTCRSWPKPLRDWRTFSSPGTATFLRSPTTYPSTSSLPEASGRGYKNGRRRFLTDLRFCCAANVVTASEAREPDAYRDSSNRLLCGWITAQSFSVRRMPLRRGRRARPIGLAPNAPPP